MRYSLVLAPAFAAVALGQSASYTNPFTSYLSMTNSVGVVTGMPSVNTDQTAVAATSQPSVVTSQPVAATQPAGTPSVATTLSPVMVGGASGTGSAGSTGNGTFTTGHPTPASSGSSATGSSKSGSTGTSSASPSSSSGSSADMVKPMLGLGFAGAIFAAFL